MVRRKRRGKRGEGTVYRSEHGWIARFPLGIVNGKRAAKRVRCRTPEEAEAELARLRRIYGSGGTPVNATLSEYLAEWLAGWEHVRESTRDTYAIHIRKHIDPLLGGIPVAKLQPADVRRLVVELKRHGAKPAYVHRVIATLRVALGAGVAERALPYNAAEHVKLPKVEAKPVRPLTHDEALAILDATANTWLGPVVRVLLGSGLRIGEVLGLDQRDVVPSGGFVRVRVSKTTVRAVPVSDDAMAALLEEMAAALRRGADEPVFFAPRRNRSGQRDRLHRWSVAHALPRILTAAGIQHLTPHALRHGAATLMLTDGHSMRVISEQLGHKNPSLTARIYAHVVPDSQRAAVRSLEPRKVQ